MMTSRMNPSKTHNKEWISNPAVIAVLSFPNIRSALPVKVAHFSLRRFVSQLLKMPFYRFHKFHTLILCELRFPHPSTFFHKIPQAPMEDTVFPHFSINSTLFINCGIYILLIYSVLCFVETCGICGTFLCMFFRETFFLSGWDTCFVVYIFWDTWSIFFRGTVFFWALPKVCLLFRCRFVRRRSLGLTAIGCTGCRDTASRISFTCSTYCLPALIPLCQRRLAWWYSLWQHSSFTLRQIHLSVGLSRGTLFAPAVRWPILFDGCHYQTSAIVRHIGSLHSAGAVQLTSSLTIPNAFFSLSLLIGFSAARQTIIRYNCNILPCLNFYDVVTCLRSRYCFRVSRDCFTTAKVRRDRFELLHYARSGSSCLAEKSSFYGCAALAIKEYFSVQNLAFRQSLPL